MLNEKILLNEKIMKEAMEMAPEIVENRRALHQFAEIGFDIPQTFEYIRNKLIEYGYSPEICGKSGLVATIGKPGKTILLRADTDALPIKEETGLDFAATNGNSHACGHDCHPAMLLGAARILKEHETELKGTVKLMFQPAEEILQGAREMINNGILENPDVDAAFAIHVMTGTKFSRTGNLICYKGNITRSGDAVRITVHGKDTHGSKSYTGIDALSISSYINLALQTVIAREIPSNENSVVLVGTTNGGTTANSVAGETILEISVRTDDNEKRAFLIKRIEEISTKIAEAFRGSVSVEHLFGSPVLVNDESFSNDLISYGSELLGKDHVDTDSAKGAGGGEDFAFISEKIPSTLFYLGFGDTEEGYTAVNHTPFVRFNEKALPVGAAVHTYFAMRWLQDNC